MRQITEIIIHCAATPGDVSAATIRKWHLEKRWRDIGYHHVIRTNGTIEAGRPIDEQGAHTFGHNVGTIGICLAGGLDGTDNYTPAQWQSLKTLVMGYMQEFGITKVTGHNNYTNQKTCPNFDVPAWVASF